MNKSKPRDSLISMLKMHSNSNSNSNSNLSLNLSLSLSLSFKIVVSFLAFGLLIACSNLPGNQKNITPNNDLATASDETDSQKRAKIRLELASGYLDQGQATIALDEVKLALLADPRSIDALSLRGLIYMRLKDFSLARESFNRGLTMNPRDGNILHNLGWLACQELRYTEATLNFDKALASPNYLGQAKTHLAKGICFLRANDTRQAESHFLRSFELDASNPITTFNLANLLYKRNDLVRAQFYIRRLNNSEYANAESLWLATKIEKKTGNAQGVLQLSERLQKEFPTSKEFGLFERGAYDE
jgi:type IV pilus assembly protein PilF